MRKTKLFLPIILASTFVCTSCNFGAVMVEGKIDSREINYNLGLIDMPHKGSPKLLVIPVMFSDVSFLGSLTAARARENIEATFFGDSTSTGWESVSSFYQKSSYNNLNLSGVVTDWYETGNSSSYYERLTYTTSTKDVTDNIAYNAVKWVKQNHPEINLDEYDTDDDGIVDAVWLVYYREFDRMSDLWWAYTTWSTIGDDGTLGKEVAPYSWASYSFIFNDSNYLKPDAHTFIHETGHLLGLDDYYDTSSSPKNPMGGLTMMDCNIGDIDSFSKYLLDWISPTVIQNAGTYTLEPFESTGQTLLIPISYSDNPYGEYLLLEYYTPTGLNRKDSLSKYSNNLQMFTESGIIVRHVDNRLGRLNYVPNGDPSWNGKYYTTIDSYRANLYIYIPVNSNTPAYSYARDTTQKLVGVIGASDTSFRAAENRTRYIFNEALYQLGDKFNAPSYESNSKETIPFSFEISAIDSSKVTITIS